MIPISYNVRSLAVRRATTIASVVGIALVVFVLASALMLSEGIHKTLGQAGRADNAFVMRKGSDNELSSVINSDTAGLIMAQPGVQKNGGVPLGVGEVMVVAAVDKLGTPGLSNVQIRGVPLDTVMAFRPGAHIVEGRMATSGTDEVIVGKAIAGRFKDLSLGESYEARRNRPLRVVGIFEDGGSAFESEVWGDLTAIQNAFGRQGIVSSVRVRLESPAAFDAFEAGIEQDKRLGLEVMHEAEYNEKQGEMTSMMITGIGVLVSVFFGLGAAIGATITMYTSIASRQREVGTLRALGFRRRAILGSFLLEALMIAFAGGVLGAGASMLMGFVRFSTMNFATWSEMVFTFTPTPGIVLTSLIVAGVTGLAGGMYPAWKASRMSPVTAMRR